MTFSHLEDRKRIIES